MIALNDKDYVVYIDTDSVYFSVLPLAKLDAPADMMKYTIDTVTEMSDQINKFYECMVPKVFNVAPDKNRIKIVPDVIAKKALWVSKKHYAMLKVYDMEKKQAVKDKQGREGKLEVKGLDVVRSSFPTAFRKFAAKILDELLRGVEREVIDEEIMRFEETINDHSIFDLAKTTSVKYISKSGEDNYNPSNRRPFEVINGTPVGVKAALAYNDLLKVWKMDKQIEKIMTGQKIKWVWLLPNDFNLPNLAMKADDTDPDRILEFVTNHINRKKMYDSELHHKLEEIYNCIGWKYPNRGSQLAEKVFDFSQEW
jgi:hypothetical protein